MLISVIKCTLYNFSSLKMYMTKNHLSNNKCMKHSFKVLEFYFGRQFDLYVLT